jgi:chloramphenicol 3-O phosphotransferase
VIVLNGGSSSGKSGIARCLQTVLPDPWLVLGTDTLVEAAPSSSPTSAVGIEFGPTGEVIVGPEFRALEAAWMTGVAAMAQAGAHIILDEVFLRGGASQRQWQEALDPLPVLWVGVRCDPEVAAAREIARGDRVLGMARSQADLVHQGMAYDLEVDTAQVEALECARIIAAHIDQSLAEGVQRGPSAQGAQQASAHAMQGGSAQSAQLGSTLGLRGASAQGTQGRSAQNPQRGSAQNPQRGSAQNPQRGSAQNPQRGSTLGSRGAGASAQGAQRGPGEGTERDRAPGTASEEQFEAWDSDGTASEEPFEAWDSDGPEPRG